MKNVLYSLIFLLYTSFVGADTINTKEKSLCLNQENLANTFKELKDIITRDRAMDGFSKNHNEMILFIENFKFTYTFVDVGKNYPVIFDKIHINDENKKISYSLSFDDFDKIYRLKPKILHSLPQRHKEEVGKIENHFCNILVTLVAKINHQDILRNFATQANKHPLFGNGLSPEITPPKDSKNALTLGFKFISFDEGKPTLEQTTILYSEPVIIHDVEYQAILFEIFDKKRIALYTPNSKIHPNLDNGKYYFRIYAIDAFDKRFMLDIQEIEKIQKFILDYGDRTIFRSFDSNNPFYKFKDFSVFLGNTKQTLGHTSNLIKDYDEIIFQTSTKPRYHTLIIKNINGKKQIVINIGWNAAIKETENFLQYALPIIKQTIQNHHKVKFGFDFLKSLILKNSQIETVYENYTVAKHNFNDIDLVYRPIDPKLETITIGHYQLIKSDGKYYIDIIKSYPEGIGEQKHKEAEEHFYNTIYPMIEKLNNKNSNTNNMHNYHLNKNNFLQIKTKINNLESKELLLKNDLSLTIVDNTTLSVNKLYNDKKRRIGLIVNDDNNIKIFALAKTQMQNNKDKQCIIQSLSTIVMLDTLHYHNMKR